jgi:hypothetical protein
MFQKLGLFLFSDEGSETESVSETFCFQGIKIQGEEQSTET